MTIGNWRVLSQPRGFDVRWLDPDTGTWISSYPRVEEGIPTPWIFYPYMLVEAVVAILGLRRTHRA